MIFAKLKRIWWLLSVLSNLLPKSSNWVKSFIHMPLSAIFLKKYGKIERMEESNGITKKRNKWKRYMGSINDLETDQKWEESLKSFNGRYKQAAVLKDISWIVRKPSRYCQEFSLEWSWLEKLYVYAHMKNVRIHAWAKYQEYYAKQWHSL